MKDIKCDKPKCKKLIGYKKQNGRKEYYDGTYQWGRFSTCSKKHLNYFISLMPNK